MLLNLFIIFYIVPFFLNWLLIELFRYQSKNIGIPIENHTSILLKLKSLIIMSLASYFFPFVWILMNVTLFYKDKDIINQINIELAKRRLGG